MSGNRKNQAAALLEAVANSAVELLRHHGLERSIPRVLETLGAATGADRMQLLQVERQHTGGEFRIVRHYGWRAPGVPPSLLVGAAEGRSMEMYGFHSWVEKFTRGEIAAGASESFAPAVRKFLESDGIRSLAVVPVFVDGRWWGQIGFDDCRGMRKWSSSEIAALRTLAELVGTAVVRSRDVARLADAQRIVENSPTILFRLGPEPPFPLRYVSPNIARYGYRASELLAAPGRWRELIDEADLTGVMNAICSIAEDEADDAIAEFRWIKPDGARVWFDGRATAFGDGKSKLQAIEGLVTDITERKKAARKIERLAHTDALTGLANRAAFLDALEEACSDGCRGNAPFAVHFIDLDRFKQVNDTFGHPVGDKLLRAVARRLAHCVREEDIVARFGGDEFAVLQRNLSLPHSAETMADKIRAIVGKPYRISGRALNLSVSVGFACHSKGQVQPDELMIRADLALYRAKKDGRDRVRAYEPALRRSARTALASNLRAFPAA